MGSLAFFRQTVNVFGASEPVAAPSVGGCGDPPAVPSGVMARVRPAAARVGRRMGLGGGSTGSTAPAFPSSTAHPLSPGPWPSGIDATRLPHHVACVMDGNGRWASRRGLPRTEGHRAGEEALFDVVEGALDLGLPWLSVYAFSTENWRRPADEVRFLMHVMSDTILGKRREELHERGVRVVFAGRRDWRVPKRVLRHMDEVVDLTSANQRMTFCIAFNYGGRAEIVDAVRALVAEGVPADRIDERAISTHLYQPGMPEPDLVIRTRASTGSPTSGCGSWPTASWSSPTRSGPTSGASTCSTPCASSRAASRRFGAVGARRRHPVVTLYRDRGVVLRTYKLGEADRIVVVLTEGHGKVRAVAKGVRKTKSRFGGRLEPTSHVSLQLYEGRELDVVTQADTLEHHRQVREDLDRLAKASAVLEAVDQVAQDREPSPQLYRMTVGALRSLEQQDSPLLLAGFYWKLLAAEGVAPLVDACARCGSDGPLVAFDLTEGGVLCRECRTGVPISADGAGPAAPGPRGRPQPGAPRTGEPGHPRARVAGHHGDGGPPRAAPALDPRPRPRLNASGDSSGRPLRWSRHARDRYGPGRQPLQEQGLRLPVGRDLRRLPLHLRLRAARRAAAAQCQGRLVAFDGPTPRRRGRPRRRHPGPAGGVEGQRPSRHVHRSAGGLPQLQGAVAGRSSPAAGGRRPGALPQLRLDRPHRGAGVQPDVQDPRRPGGGRLDRRLSAAGDGPGHVHQLQERHPDDPQEAAVRHRPDRQELPQRDHARQLRLPHPRVRADGARVLRAAERIQAVVRVLGRGALPLVRRPGHPGGHAAGPSPRDGGAEPLLGRHLRRRVRIPVRLGRARGHRPAHRFRSDRPLPGVRGTPRLVRPGDGGAVHARTWSSRRRAPPGR